MLLSTILFRETAHALGVSPPFGVNQSPQNHNQEDKNYSLIIIIDWNSLKLFEAKENGLRNNHDHLFISTDRNLGETIDNFKIFQHNLCSCRLILLLSKRIFLFSAKCLFTTSSIFAVIKLQSFKKIYQSFSNHLFSTSCYSRQIQLNSYDFSLYFFNTTWMSV